MKERTNGHTLRSIRKGLKLSQWDLSLITGLSPSRISALENHVQVPSNDEIDLLASALNIQEDLIDFDLLVSEKRQALRAGIQAKTAKLRRKA